MQNAGLERTQRPLRKRRSRNEGSDTDVQLTLPRIVELPWIAMIQLLKSLKTSRLYTNHCDKDEDGRWQL
jgi:hypothetical protein